MSVWTPSADRTHFLRHGRPDLLLADTWWAGLLVPSLVEFDDAAALRQRQGFNAVLMSLLPLVHDQSADGPSPWQAGPDGEPEPGVLSADYLISIDARMRVLRERGLTPVVVPIWCCYVPDTWASNGHEDAVLDLEQTEQVLQTIVPLLAPYDPIWVASGDDRFDSGTSNRRVAQVIKLLRDLAPDALVTLHPAGDTLPPEHLLELVDFVLLQSGHDASPERDWHETPVPLTQRALATGHTLIVNAEPPYEGHGRRAGGARHRDHDVRLAAWRSVLAGASAGLGYGAHGVWSWHRRGAGFTSESWSGIPFPASVALQFPGAWTMGDLRRIVVEEQLWGLRDVTDTVLPGDPSGARAGASVDGKLVVLHCPEPFRVRLHVDPEALRLTRSLNLASGRDEVVGTTATDGILLLEQPEFLADGLHILRAVDAGPDSGTPSAVDPTARLSVRGTR